MAPTRKTGPLPRRPCARSLASGLLATALLAGCADLLVADAGGIRFEAEAGDPSTAPLFHSAKRLHEVAYRLKSGGVAWCEPFARHEVGLVYWSDAIAAQLGGAAGAGMLPRGPAPSVLFVALDSAAGRAGVEPGDVLLALDEVPLAGGAAGTEQLSRWTEALGTAPRPTTLLLRRKDQTVSVALTPDRVCDFGIVLRNESYPRVRLATGHRLELNVGTVNMYNDDLLSFALAHVMSHGVLRHDEATHSSMNAAQVADVPFFIVGFTLAVASMGAYPQAAAMPFSTMNEARLRKLEPEADLWGLAMMAAAGFDISRPRLLPVFDDLVSFEERARESQARSDRLEQAATLLAQWQRSGRPLAPDPETLKALLPTATPGPSQ